MPAIFVNDCRECPRHLNYPRIKIVKSCSFLLEQKGKTSLQTSTAVCNRGKSAKKLDEIAKIQKMGRPKIPNDEVHAALLVFAMSPAEPKQNEVEAFFQLITSDQNMPIDKVETVLEKLSMSKSVRHHHLMQKLLKEKLFEGKWKQVSFESKLSIYTSWIDSKVAIEGQQKHGRPATACKAIDDLMSCLLNVSNEGLVEHLWKHVSKTFLKKELILKAFKNVEKLSPVVQDGYKNHVKAILRDPLLLRKPPEALKQWSQSR